MPIGHTLGAMNSSRSGASASFGPYTDHTLRNAMDMDCSISLAPGELQRYLDLNSTTALPPANSPTIAQLPRHQQHQHQKRLQQQRTGIGGGANSSLLFGSVDSLANASTTLGAAGAAAAAAQRQRTDALFAHFLEVVQARTNDSEIFETVRDLIQVCTDTLGELNTGSGGGGDATTGGGRALASVVARDRRDHEWLTKERDTWRLLYALYKDRLCVQPQSDSATTGGGIDEPMSEDVPAATAALMRSERDIVERLYAQNANLREYQLIVDWLEQSAAEQETQRGAQIGCFTDRTVGWENTLMQLKDADQSMFGGGREVVKSMDPDAPLREKRRLHDLDEEDQQRLAVQILREIRMGRIEEAQALCEHCGQPWQAAVLEGWRLHHDANYEQEGEQTKKLAIEGNPRRDLWKLLAWRTADHAALDATTRAIAGILCGHLGAAIAPLSHSWPDLLWAYLKVQIDLRVESEIRSCSARGHIEMPAAYWAGKMTLEQIFGELQAHDNAAVSVAARHPMHAVQRFIILDSVPDLLTAIDGWLIASGAGDAQQLRFLAHLVLFMRQIGRMPGDVDVADRCIKAYVECLIGNGADASLVAFYTAAVPVELQTVLYGRYLRTVVETTARRQALDEAQLVGLDVCAVTCHTVDAVRRSATAGADEAGDNENGRGDDDNGLNANNRDAANDEQQQLSGTVTARDSRRISALEWLTFYAEQKGDLLWQACAMIRTFLGEQRVECVRRAFEMVPVDTVGRLLEEHGGAENLPYREECTVKEYLCYQSYLGALDAYNDWTRCFHAKPAEPRLAAATAAFTERIAAEHREQAYRAELQRWRVALDEQTRVTRELMFGVLRCPEGGFLVDPELVEAAGSAAAEAVLRGVEGWRERGVQLDSLRQLCVPEVVVLLHRVLHEAGDWRQCVRLADELADEQRKLYAVYARHRLAEIIGKIAESSLALMNEKLDPWGYTAGA